MDGGYDSNTHLSDDDWERGGGEMCNGCRNVQGVDAAIWNGGVVRWFKIPGSKSNIFGTKLEFYFLTFKQIKNIGRGGPDSPDTPKSASAYDLVTMVPGADENVADSSLGHSKLLALLPSLNYAIYSYKWHFAHTLLK